MDETHYCHICSRSGAPSQNKIIFCDSCGTPYHQLCHQPNVSEATFNSGKEWFCSSCKPPTAVEGMSPRMMGQGIPEAQVPLFYCRISLKKRAILQSLHPNQLIDLLVYASDMYPNLDIFPTGEVDQFQVPRLHPAPRLQRMPDIDVNSHPQYNDNRLQDPQNPPPGLPMTPMQEPPPHHQSPMESPMYGQNVDLPHYELMIVNALQAINDPNGSAPKAIWEWMNKYFLLWANFDVVIILVIPNFGHRHLKLCKKLLRKVVC